MNTLISTPDLSDTAVTITAPVDTLHRWADEGWLRRLDSALAAFMRELDPGARPALLVSTAILAQMEGRGHTCLPLTVLMSQPNEVLAWTEAAQEELTALWATLPVDLTAWLQALQASPLVRSVTTQLTDEELDEPDHGQPLVLGGTPAQPLFYLRRYWLHERQVARSVLERTAASQPVDEPLARQWLDRLFDPADHTDGSAFEIDWQKLACAVALRASLTVITGGPGTGKTYTAARLLALLFATHEDPQHLRVALAAPTGKAAARLRQSIDASLQELSTRLGDDLDLPTFTKRMGAARTLHSLLGARPDTRTFSFNASHLLDVDILIVDEASMIHLEMMSALLQAMPPGSKLILLGDKDQLASVEAGAVLGDLCRDADKGGYSMDTARYVQTVAGQTLPSEFLTTESRFTALSQQTVMLRKSRRFGGQIGQLALAVNAGNSEQAQHLITHDTSGALQATVHPSVTTVLDLAVHGRLGASACYADYLRLVSARPQVAAKDPAAHDDWVKAVLVAFDRFRILCAVHEGDWGTRSLNQTVQQALAEANLLKPRGEWFAGRPVMVTRNDPELGVFNGDVGVALPGSQGHALRVYFLDGDSLRSVGVSRLAHVETAFAMTVHKSQGSEFLHTVLVLPQGGAKVLTRELVYTGITRARESFTLVEGEPGLLHRATLRQSQRASGLGLQLGCSLVTNGT
ncbi:MAG: exodeoxyribonuclease V subunit alpha [Rhodoferax sp.]